MKSLPSTKAYGGVEFVGASSDTRSRIEFVFIATELKIPSLGYERSTDSWTVRPPGWSHCDVLLKNNILTAVT